MNKRGRCHVRFTGTCISCSSVNANHNLLTSNLPSLWLFNFFFFFFSCECFSRASLSVIYSTVSFFSPNLHSLRSPLLLGFRFLGTSRRLPVIFLASKFSLQFFELWFLIGSLRNLRLFHFAGFRWCFLVDS